MGVGGYPRAHVVVLRYGSSLECFDVAHDPDAFHGLVRIAEDFRRRLAAGGPFAENAASVKRRWPADDGTEMEADGYLSEAAHRLLGVRDSIMVLTEQQELLETDIKTRMGEAARLVGDNFTVTWKRGKDRQTINWPSIAERAIENLPEEERVRLMVEHTVYLPGHRPFVIRKKEAS